MDEVGRDVGTACRLNKTIHQRLIVEWVGIQVADVQMLKKFRIAHHVLVGRQLTVILILVGTWWMVWRCGDDRRGVHLSEWITYEFIHVITHVMVVMVCFICGRSRRRLVVRC